MVLKLESWRPIAAINKKEFSVRFGFVQKLWKIKIMKNSIFKQYFQYALILIVFLSLISNLKFHSSLDFLLKKFLKILKIFVKFRLIFLLKGHNSPLHQRPKDNQLDKEYTIEFAVNYYIELGADPKKIV
jgi:hypothetical protein